MRIKVRIKDGFYTVWIRRSWYFIHWWDEVLDTRQERIFNRYLKELRE